MKSFTLSEVKQHNKENDGQIVIENKVQDVTQFMGLHPGGKAVLMSVLGTDATEQFQELHRTKVLDRQERLVIGTVSDKKPPKEIKTPISPVPWGENSFLQGFRSPFQNESHTKFRLAVRNFFETEFKDIDTLEEMGKQPTIEKWKKMADNDIILCSIHAEMVKAYKKGTNDTRMPGGIAVDDFDSFHEMIHHEESGRWFTPGYMDGLFAGLNIGLPPVFLFGSKSMAKKVGHDVVSGAKRICLAISEPFAGSDVAGIVTKATKSDDGKHQIVNGSKKWITNGMFSDYFVTAVRTGGKGLGGISLLMIEKSPGVSVKPIKTSYSLCAGTALVLFDEVKVPVENLMGKENEGFKCIMANFNHERWMIVVALNGAVRRVIEDSIKWVNQRKAFGKTLINQPVLREKLAHMVMKFESLNAWAENITQQMTKMSHKEQFAKLGGPIALLKVQCTRVAHDVSDDACQIFGGRGITRTGMGNRVELLQKSYKFQAIYGGSEEILCDLAIRTAMRGFPKDRSAKL